MFVFGLVYWFTDRLITVVVRFLRWFDSPRGVNVAPKDAAEMMVLNFRPRDGIGRASEIQVLTRRNGIMEV